MNGHHFLSLEEIHQPLTAKDLNSRKVYTIIPLNISPTKAPKKIYQNAREQD